MHGNKHGIAIKISFALLWLWNILNIVLAWCVSGGVPACKHWCVSTLAELSYGRFSVGNAYVAVLIVFNTAGGLADQTRTDGEPSGPAPNSTGTYTFCPCCLRQSSNLCAPTISPCHTESRWPTQS